MTEIKANGEMIYTLTGLTEKDIRLIHLGLETFGNAINPELKVRRRLIMDSIDNLIEING